MHGCTQVPHEPFAAQIKQESEKNLLVFLITGLIVSLLVWPVHTAIATASVNFRVLSAGVTATLLPVLQ